MDDFFPNIFAFHDPDWTEEKTRSVFDQMLFLADAIRFHEVMVDDACEGEQCDGNCEDCVLNESAKG